MGDPELRKRAQQEVERLTGHSARSASNLGTQNGQSERPRLGRELYRNLPFSWWKKTYQKNEECPMSIGESIKIQWTRGMANVKAFFKELSRTVAFVERGGDPRVLQTSLNLRLTGNPGMLGKTLVRHGQHCQHIYIYVYMYICMYTFHLLGHVVHVPEV